MSKIKNDAPIVLFEAMEPEPIAYKRGKAYVNLTGVLAAIHRAEVILDGEAKAREIFWWLFHKENGVITPENAVQSL